MSLKNIIKDWITDGIGIAVWGLAGYLLYCGGPWVAFIALELARNYVLIEKRKIRPNYLASFIIRAFFGLMCLVLTYPDFDPLVNGLDYWPYVVYECTSFWLLFDPLLNVLRGKGLTYKGANSGWLDRLPAWAYWSLKVCALIGLIFVLKYT